MSGADRTTTILMVEGRRMMRLSHELPGEQFGALLDAYQRLLRGVLETMGAREVEVSNDTATARFATARAAALAAAAAQRAVEAHEWPHDRDVEISAGLHSVQARGSAGSAATRCAELCDAAEGGQTFLSQTTADLLDDEDLGGLVVLDRGEKQTRRSERAVRASELVAAT